MSDILLVEDDSSLGPTMKERLEKEGHNVSLVDTESEAKSILENKIFNLIILDIGLSQGNGFEVAEWLKKKRSTPIIFVTAQSDADHRLKGFELGAEEFLPKPFHLKEFLMRVKHVLDNHVPADIIKLNNCSINFFAQQLTDQQGKIHSLSLKENQILQMLWQTSPEVVSRDELLEKIWGGEELPSNRTIDNQIVKLRQLLNDKNTEIIKTVRGVGYQLITLNGEENV